ncbi:MAG: hypothetical protein WC378_04250 [Opitutaceae bacterium]|jgi:hypothetical protein
MNFDDLSNLWRRQAPTPLPQIDVEGLQRSFETKRRRMARTLFWRDMIEILAGVFVAVVFAWTGWKMGPGGWPIAASVILIFFVIAVFIRERVRAHVLQLAADASLIDKLDADIAELRHQQGLLLSVDRWYIAPITAAAGIYSVTILANAPIPMKVKLFAGAQTLVVFGLSWWGVRALNHRAVRKNIEPRLRDLEELQRSLSSDRDINT